MLDHEAKGKLEVRHSFVGFILLNPVIPETVERQGGI
jgi:hypothetical protein